MNQTGGCYDRGAKLNRMNPLAKKSFDVKEVIASNREHI